MFWNLIARICLALLSLRYKIEVRGRKALNAENLSRESILFLPNHTAHMEVLFLFMLLWPKFRMRPVVIEYVFRQKLLKPLMRLVQAIPIPNLDTSINQIKLKRAEKSMLESAQVLKQKKNLILYPSGRLKTSAKEILGGASGAHALLQECPETQVVLIRTTGLWGSSFSCAIKGRSPDVNASLWFGVKTLFRNFLFFCPRRKVTIEIEQAGPDFPKAGSRIEFNRYLEHWYNQYPDEQGNRTEEEPLQLVSYSMWRDELLKPFASPKKKSEGNGAVISNDTKDKIFAEIRRILNNPNLNIEEEMTLATDLGMDSLNIAELMAFLSQKYELPEIHPEDLDTVRKILEIAEGSASPSGPSRHAVVHTTWPEEEERPAPVPPMGRTIPEAFLNSCQRMGSFSACGDDLVGVLSYKKLKRAALVLAEYFRTLDGKYIGVLLPASSGAFITILALQLAGKVPVMLNWTLGPRYLDDMMRLSGAKVAISSWRFLDRLSHVEFGTLSEQLLLLEDIRDHLSIGQKLRGAFLALHGPKRILSALKLHDLEDKEPAVVLFTSGTEASPKGVPLSHKNILSNLRSGMHCIEFRSEDVLYGILPPFHSFGFSVAGLVGFLSGMRLAFYPDPTDSFALAEGIERWKVTIFCSAPSFLRSLFQAAKKEQLRSVRIFVTGAEKASPELFEKVKNLGNRAKLIEGYGITECSPILTLNRFNVPPKGVGSPLPDVEICIIHPETREILPLDVDGEICVRGPNVFNGYLGNPRSPFIELRGKQWYLTGDFGHLEENSLILSGRLKRFTKLGGEMISLGAVEEALASALMSEGKLKADEPSIALIADERVPEKPQLVLFSTVDIDQEKANEILSSAGFSRLIKISMVKKIEEIPILGTGKTNYRELQSKL